MKSRPSRLQRARAATLDSQGHAFDLEQRWSFPHRHILSIQVAQYGSDNLHDTGSQLTNRALSTIALLVSELANP